jgi:two-component system cell cycle sensor histidine kinase/response regulator CckA
MESRQEKPDAPLPTSDWYYHLFQTSPDSLLVTRARDGRITEMNSRFLEVMGYSREELIGRTPLQLGFWVYPEDREALMNLLREARGHCSGFETTMRNKQGSEIPVLLSARLTEIGGEPYVVSQSREDSERRQIKKALQESENNFLKTLQGEKTGDLEYEVLKKDGSPFQALIAAAPIVRDSQTIGVRGVISDITGLRKAEKELQEGRDLYQTLVEMSNDAITMVRGDIHRYVNPKMVEIFGYERADEIVGHSILQMIHPDDRERVQETNRKRQKGEAVPDKYVFKGIRKDNQPIFLETSAKRLQYRGENVSLVFLRDITDRFKAQEELKASEEKYRLVVDHANEAIFIAQEGLLKLVNPKALEITGYDRETLQTKPFHELIQPDDRAMVVDRHLRRARGEDLPPVYSFRIVDREGQVKVVEINAVRIDWEGRPATLNFLSDITDRRLAEEALRESQERTRLIFNTVPDSITITRVEDGRYILVNDYFCQLTGYSREETIGRTVTDLNVFVNAQDRDRFIREMREKGEANDFEIQYRKKDGSLFTTLLSARSIRYAGEDCLVAVVTDITEKKQLEMQFLQAQKMEAVGRLAGGVAHDFNNLLTSILGHSDLMLMRLRPGDPLVGDIGEIVKAANRATDLTRQLLAFSRKQIMQPKILNLNVIISDMKKMLRRLIGEDITLETLLSPDLGRVLVDPGQIDQVIMNLVVNARDAMPQGGTLTIETVNTQIDEVQVRQYLGAKPGAYVLLSVKDSGSGISEEVQSHIFEPFFTTKELGKGTGLGLSTVYGIVKQSNGYVWVDSRPGQGTEFKIFLPLQEGEAESDLKLERVNGSLRGEETILLAEDNEMVRGLTRSVLEHFGYQVLETEDGEEAGRMSRGYEGVIQLLLTDVVMPGISGRVLADQLQISRPGIKILFMSGYSEEAVLLQGMQILGAHFLQKPFTPEELGLRVREILDSAA